MTEALLALLADEDGPIRYAAAEALAGSSSPQALLTLAAGHYQRSFSTWPELANVAERLTIRHYLRVEPEERPALRAAIAQLTATAASHTQE